MPRWLSSDERSEEHIETTSLQYNFYHKITSEVCWFRYGLDVHSPYSTNGVSLDTTLGSGAGGACFNSKR